MQNDDSELLEQNENVLARRNLLKFGISAAALGGAGILNSASATEAAICTPIAEQLFFPFTPQTLATLDAAIKAFNQATNQIDELTQKIENAGKFTGQLSHDAVLAAYLHDQELVALSIDRKASDIAADMYGSIIEALKRQEKQDGKKKKPDAKSESKMIEAKLAKNKLDLAEINRELEQLKKKLE